MSNPRGRPHASSREVLTDAACELFLEQGYEATSVTEIARRAGVSRSSFFNYFEGKSAILWFVLDEQIDALVQRVEDPELTLDEALDAFADGTAPTHSPSLLSTPETWGSKLNCVRGRRCDSCESPTLWRIA
ncbi:TetR family transcriptional regulator [Leucobacter coleopterorum]|uniref:TetR family transcriptional regulator n=2 Tax=Leucobacter coleopterorum TaxID=2714933 RepID=A0ABX6JZP4_9MICO|nr:TetR family transcriptional regulator [Leucobacter coleopterorum]